MIGRPPHKQIVPIPIAQAKAKAYPRYFAKEEAPFSLTDLSISF